MNLLNNHEDTINDIEELRPAFNDPTKMVVMQQQSFVNFTRYGVKPATYINVIRNPIDKFISTYYGCRFGTVGHPGVNNACSDLSINERMMKVEDYLTSSEGLSLTNQKINYVTWLCDSPDNDPNCR